MEYSVLTQHLLQLVTNILFTHSVDMNVYVTYRLENNVLPKDNQIYLETMGDDAFHWYVFLT